VRVLGCPVAALEAMGVETAAWDVVPFGAEPVERFLESLDVFSYFHHPRLVESFGRTVVEAALMGRPCVLDRTLEPSFGTLATCCTPEEVPAVAARLREDVAGTQERAEAVREACLAAFGIASLEARLAALTADAGEPARRGPVAVGPLLTLRRVAGLHRRMRQTGWT
jgi:hypothetical protein